MTNAMFELSVKSPRISMILHPLVVVYMHARFLQIKCFSGFLEKVEVRVYSHPE